VGEITVSVVGSKNPNWFDTHQILDLIFEDNRLNVYAGELEVRPPGAPTTTTGEREARLLDSSSRQRGPSGSGAGHSLAGSLARVS
jgi:hypothetical protein